MTELLLFRPFVLLCLELKRRGIKDILSERNGQVEMAVLFEAAKRSVRSAKDMIRFCDSLFSLQLGIEVRDCGDVKWCDTEQDRVCIRTAST